MMLDLELGRVGLYRDSDIDIADITILYSNTPPLCSTTRACTKAAREKQHLLKAEECIQTTTAACFHTSNSLSLSTVHVVPSMSFLRGILLVNTRSAGYIHSDRNNTNTRTTIKSYSV